MVGCVTKKNVESYENENDTNKYALLCIYWSQFVFSLTFYNQIVTILGSGYIWVG